jgi:hypothetical protein
MKSFSTVIFLYEILFHCNILSKHHHHKGKVLINVLNWAGLVINGLVAFILPLILICKIIERIHIDTNRRKLILILEKLGILHVFEGTEERLNQVYMYVSMGVYMCMYVYVGIYIWIYICICIHLFIHILIFIFIFNQVAYYDSEIDNESKYDSTYVSTSHPKKTENGVNGINNINIYNDNNNNNNNDNNNYSNYNNNSNNDINNNGNNNEYNNNDNYHEKIHSKISTYNNHPFESKEIEIRYVYMRENMHMYVYM